MAYPLSKQTRVFPFASGRTITDETGTKKLFPYDHVLNEHNISNMIKVVNDKSNYLISFDESSRFLKFVINGYYFETIVPNSIDLSKNLWVTVSTFDKENNYTYLSAEDNDSSEFTGIDFSETDPNSAYSIQILDNGNINKSSYLKIDAKSVCAFFKNNINLEDDLKTLNDELEKETKQRNAADKTHSDDIDELKTNLATETSNRKTTDNSLSDRISSLESKLKWKKYS